MHDDRQITYIQQYYHEIQACRPTLGGEYLGCEHYVLKQQKFLTWNVIWLLFLDISK